MVRDNSGRGIWHPKQGFGMQSLVGMGAPASLLIGAAVCMPGRAIESYEAPKPLSRPHRRYFEVILRSFAWAPNDLVLAQGFRVKSSEWKKIGRLR